MKLKNRIKIILVLLFTMVIVVPSKSNANMSFEESSETIRNPDRGFYKLVQRELQKDKENIESFEKEIQNISKEDTDVSIISFQLNLKNFVSLNTNISEEKIEEINQYFSIMRKYGYQVIFRVVYDSKGEKNPEPEFNIILNHIDELKKIYVDNEDIILVVEAGYLGSYGEWHSGKYDKDKEKRNQLIEKLLNVVPEKIQINLRKPSFITDYIGNQTITEKNAFSNEKVSRLGLHNDGYLASETDLGTFPKEEREQNLLWQEKQTRFTIFGGECQNKDSIYTNLDNAITDMEKRHCTYLNKTYDREVKEKWKNSTYNGSNVIYKGETGYKYIQDHLGYRLILKESNINIENGKAKISLLIENSGFGDIIREKRLQFVLKDEENNYYIDSDIDIRKQKLDKNYQFTILEKLPENIKEGQYEVYLKIQETYDSLKDNQYYQIKLANKNIWNNSVGANYIGEINIKNENIINNIDSKNNNMFIKILICIGIILLIGFLIFRIEKRK